MDLGGVFVDALAAKDIVVGVGSNLRFWPLLEVRIGGVYLLRDTIEETCLFYLLFRATPNKEVKLTFLMSGGVSLVILVPSNSVVVGAGIFVALGFIFLRKGRIYLVFLVICTK